MAGTEVPVMLSVGELQESYGVLFVASKDGIVAVTIAVLSTTGFSLGLVLTIKLITDRAFASLANPQTRAIVTTSQGMIFFAGTVTFGALCFYLRPSQNPAVKPPKGLYEALVTYIVARGFLATVVQLGFVLTFAAMPSTPVWMPFHLVASKLYVNSLLTMSVKAQDSAFSSFPNLQPTRLNSREIYRGHGINEEDPISRSDDTTSFSASPPRLNSNVRFDFIDTKPAINVDMPPSTPDSETSESTRRMPTTTSMSIYDDEDEPHDWNHKRVGVAL
ncbi:unnamed protein product [Cyclocybe aegerita]|uniref:DUF6534 domain-containing protein n=1 Tax=Cyclocybe aegerita TaxID=1973307 RepID=A0A8S0WXP5_CYCAE|nr:unnamed protein product [Cyclocybe aegerita]